MCFAENKSSDFMNGGIDDDDGANDDIDDVSDDNNRLWLHWPFPLLVQKMIMTSKTDMLKRQHHWAKFWYFLTFALENYILETYVRK